MAHDVFDVAGVGITGELPDDGVDAAASTHGSCSDQQVSSWQDPTERLALALGLQVSQLAHMTGIVPGNPDGALHRLRCGGRLPLRGDPGVQEDAGSQESGGLRSLPHRVFLEASQ